MVAVGKDDMTGIAVISCDVFDTLLLRDLRSQTSRFQAAARRASRGLRDGLGIAVEERAVLHARLSVHRIAYRALSLANPSGEVRFRDIVDAMAASLALGPAGAAILAEAEIAVEREHLRPNRRLFAWLARQAEAGRRIIAVSDTWHSARTIRGLLDALRPDHPLRAVYTSADANATKRSSALFRHVADAERVRPGEILHLGDDAAADHVMALRGGLRSRPLTRPAYRTFVRAADALLSGRRAPSLPH